MVLSSNMRYMVHPLAIEDIIVVSDIEIYGLQKFPRYSAPTTSGISILNLDQ